MVNPKNDTYPENSAEQSWEADLSLDRRRAMTNISASTSPTGPAIEEKRQIIQQVVGRNFLSMTQLREYPTVYAGSRSDIEYPLALGCRRIIMVDPVFEDEAYKVQVKERIRALIDDEPAQQEEGELTFSFDFGEGDEDVIVELIPRYYNPQKPRKLPFMDQAPEPVPESLTYTLPDQVGMILGYASHYVQIEPTDINNLVVGGVVLDAEPYRVVVDAPDGDYDKAYGSLGLASIHLSEGAAGAFLVQKVEVY